VRAFAPSPKLAPFVREIMIVEVEHETMRLRLPEPGLVLGVRYGGVAHVLDDDADADADADAADDDDDDDARTTRLPDLTLTGMSTRAWPMRTSAGGRIAMVRFQPGGAAPFFQAQLHEVFGKSIALDSILPHRDLDRASARVREAKSDAERVAALEDLLLNRFKPLADPLVAKAVRMIVDSRGKIQVRALVRQLAISQDPLEKRFRRIVGASPKQLASMIRLRHAIDAYRPQRGGGGNTPSLTQIALDAGYFDQAHFNHHFRAVTGVSPRRFFEMSGCRS
jgi:AraC-like DNA-binding protein